MDALAQHQAVFATLWVVWFFVLFAGILYRTLRPSRRAVLQDHAQIPFREQDRT